MIPSTAKALPISDLVPEILESLEKSPNLVLQAPPGAGKTTVLPLALRDAAWRAGRRILVLEPRRIAAKAAAHRLAESLGEAVGGQVGYHVRQEKCLGPKTIIELVTEGILTRHLQRDPELQDVAAILFDEVHERSLQGDLGLALSLEIQRALRDDLRLMAMSATLDGEKLAQIMAYEGRPAPIVTSDGRSYPVTLRYCPLPAAQTRLQQRVAAVPDLVEQALTEEPEGGLLVFLPGEGEIRQVGANLEKRFQHRQDVSLHPLFGAMPLAAQNKAIRPDSQGRRKIVLATAVAETSLTLEGIRIVLDTGLRRVSLFDPKSGMARLETQKGTQAGAKQRAGRAGRQEPGTCYRLWREAEQRGLLAQPAPEIQTADLASLALELALWGDGSGDHLPWIDPPPKASLAQARDLLKDLGALEAIEEEKIGAITDHGRAMAALPLHPRLAHMILRAQAYNAASGRLACDLAALLEARDYKPQTGARQSDLRENLALFAQRQGGFSQRSRDLAKQFRQSLRKIPPGQEGGRAVLSCGALLSFAYPDRIAQKRGTSPASKRQETPESLFRLRNGRGAKLPGYESLAGEDWLVIASLDGAGRDAKIQQAAPVDRETLEDLHAEALTSGPDITWDFREKKVIARHVQRLGHCILKERPLPDPDPEKVQAALLTGIRLMGLSCLPWSKSSVQLRDRLAFLAQKAGTETGVSDDGGLWPKMDDTTLLDSLEEWLGPFLGGLNRAAHLAKLDLYEALLSPLDYRQRQALDRLVPSHITVPSGASLALDYQADEGPALDVRLQDMFGQTETPTILEGRHPVLLRLLSPAHRPVQVTRDLAGFWTGSYKAVKADLKGRYPKHAWPDDPLSAPAGQRHAKPKKT